ncbi:CPBP family intramembrane glutamic endopeptidase [Pseudoalteromonas fenneropenaei]|uniref:CPBP family intramembrane glutamic endopeptidase n=1 Tax=Pseudoalteromonas fenneropenaei TaxID=1737459 RepID=A0ABV7CIR8_9GAMM
MSMDTQFNLFGLALTGNILAAFLPALLALIAITFGKQKAALLLTGAACVIALRVGVLNPIALVGLACLFGLSYGFAHCQHNGGKMALGLALFVVVVALLVHALPGFNNPLVTEAVLINDNAVPYAKHLNFDKLMVAIALMCFVMPSRLSATVKDWQRIGLVSLATLLIGFGAGLTSGLVNFAPKWSEYFVGWALINLFVTCFAEEAFFRGFIQTQIAKVTQHLRFSRYYPLLFSGLLFGLAHFPAGFAYTGIATLLGLACAYGYQKSHNLLVPIGIHFGFNLIHFCFFTYPFIAR